MWRDNQRVQQAERNSPSMKPGEKGDAVHLLQAALILNNIDVPHHGVTNGVKNDNYLSETQAAVRAAEQRFNLTRDNGIAGQQVIQALDRATDKFYTDRVGHFGRDLAVQDAPRAAEKVERAINAVRALRDHVAGAPSTPSPFTVANAALRTHFRLLTPGTTGPGFTRAATAADLDRILRTYVDIAFVLRAATFAFRDAIPFNGVKTAAESPTNSRRVDFGPAYRDFQDSPSDLIGGRIGKASRVAVCIHESMHAVDATNTSGNAPIHISEFDPAYDTQPADLSLVNPSSYASFAAHVFAGSDPQPRFGLGPQSRGLEETSGGAPVPFIL
jgi:hypothetical protein